MARKDRPPRKGRKFIETRGHDYGYCAICGSLGPLTEDHVPPRDCGNTESYLVRPLGHTPDDGSTRISQGGVKFKTLCGACNNDRLGARYDRDLSALARELGRYLSLARQGIQLPPALKISANPHRVARAVVGHVLAAASVQRTPSPPATFPAETTLREYFLDPVAAAPNGWKFHYWLYPWTENVVAKYFSRLDTRFGRLSFGHCLKFFPLGFYLSWKLDASTLNGREWDHNADLGDLFYGGPFGPEDKTELEFWPHYNVPPGFPERPGDSAIIALDDANAYVAQPK